MAEEDAVTEESSKPQEIGSLESGSNDNSEANKLIPQSGTLSVGLFPLLFLGAPYIHSFQWWFPTLHYILLTISFGGE